MIFLDYFGMAHPRVTVLNRYFIYSNFILEKNTFTDKMSLESLLKTGRSQGKLYHSHCVGEYSQQNKTWKKFVMLIREEHKKLALFAKHVL